MTGARAFPRGTLALYKAAQALAALRGEPGLAVGNAIGSNIPNIGLVLGIVALVALAAFIVDWVVIGPLRGRVY